MNDKQPSVFGGACIIASVCVGAGMLALPISGAGAWSGWTVAVIIMTMCMMTLGGWLLLEAYKPYELRASFNTEPPQNYRRADGLDQAALSNPSFWR